MPARSDKVVSGLDQVDIEIMDMPYPYLDVFSQLIYTYIHMNLAEL